MKDTATSGLTRLEEQRMIRALQRGDCSAARPLIDHHSQRLFAFVWRMIPNHQDAEDICQEAFLKAIASIDSFDTTYRFSTWLFTIAYRLCLNEMRRRQKNPGGELDATRIAGSEADESDVIESEEARRLRRLVWEAVERLSASQRASITLFYREAMSCQEIATIMEVPVATVKSHLHRARAKLKEMLEPAFAGDWNKIRILSEAVA